MTGLSRRVEELLPGITLTIPEGLSCIEDTPSRREKIPQKGKLCGVLVEPEVVVEGTFGEIRYVLVDYRV